MRFTLKLAGLLLVSGMLITSLGANSLADDDLSPAVPSIASLILPGAGQLINEQPNKALTHFIVVVGIDSATMLLTSVLSPSYPYDPTYDPTLVQTISSIGLVLHLAWSGYSAYDAYQVASGRQQSIFGSSLELDSTEPTNTDLELASSALNISRPSREFSVSTVNR